jgi:hypothetical protein
LSRRFKEAAARTRSEGPRERSEVGIARGESALAADTRGSIPMRQSKEAAVRVAGSLRERFWQRRIAVTRDERVGGH